jgi:serine/threonine-protein kinase
VPNVVGKDFEEAFDILSSHGLRIKKMSKPSEVVPDGYVIKQNPSPGRKVRKGRRITLIVSEGKVYVLVPDVKGMPFSLARNALHHAGEGALRVGYIAHVYSEDVKEGVVIAQSPSGMMRVPKGTRVSLLLSLGPWPREFEMPDLKGMEVEEALKKVERAGLIVRRIDETESYLLKRIVITQNPPPGYIVEEGNLVSLRVSKGLEWEKEVGPRYEIIRFIVPKGFYYREVEFLLVDKDGERKIYSEVKRPGEFIEIPVKVMGEAKVRIFVDGVLYEERIL